MLENHLIKNGTVDNQTVSESFLLLNKDKKHDDTLNLLLNSIIYNHIKPIMGQEVSYISIKML